ncbi:MAG TPA: radical SAM family heme chaperone HemW, partial [Candidatus Sulfotelmatobacter sp.]|nr:radical SAM family heme chaperone HemW [Candidatus Sulfotelmatobacter sp.]
MYVQVPFCQTKCTYCNFHTGVVSAARFAPYVDAVCAEIAGYRAFYGGAGVQMPSALADAVVDSVYIGGGTPSLLDPAHLGRIMDTIRETFASDLREVTLEADPETITAEKVAAWVAAGIRRVSFGVQSFCDSELQAAGRMHRRDDVYRAVPVLRAAAIENISFDLIAGLPGQTRESWRDSLEQLSALTPQHVSIYLLEVDEGSRLGSEILRGGLRYGAARVPTDDEMAEFYETACEFLERAGFRHYEISNWARAGFESRHNLKYWRRQPYLGFGAGAHSFSGTQRWANAHDAAVYVAAVGAGNLPVEQVEAVTRESALEEELFLGLRKLDGIDVAQIEAEYGVAVESRFERLMSAGLVQREGNWVRLAPGKLSIANEVF